MEKEEIIKINPEDVIVEDYKNDLQLTRSNVLITGRCTSSTIENKIMGIAIAKLQHNYNKNLDVVFTAAELRQQMQCPKGSNFYAELKKTTKGIVKNYYFIENPETQQFIAGAIVTDASYGNGQYKLTFNKNIEKFIWKLKTNYTPMRLSILMKFKNKSNSYSYRLYEVLRTLYFRITTENPYVLKSYTLAELQVLIGYVNLNDPKIQAALEREESPEKIIEIASKGTAGTRYKWGDFSRHVLLPAIEEINEITDIQITMIPKMSQKGGKITSLIFKIENNEKNASLYGNIIKEQNAAASSTDDLIQFERIVKEPMLTEDKLAVIKAAEGDFERIKDAYALMSEQKSKITNIAGWLIKAIKEQWNKESSYNLEDIMKTVPESVKTDEEQKNYSSQAAMFYMEEKINKEKENQNDLLKIFEELYNKDQANQKAKNH